MGVKIMFLFLPRRMNFLDSTVELHRFDITATMMMMVMTERHGRVGGVLVPY
jgi:hypothetical protein